MKRKLRWPSKFDFFLLPDSCKDVTPFFQLPQPFPLHFCYYRPCPLTKPKQTIPLLSGFCQAFFVLQQQLIWWHSIRQEDSLHQDSMNTALVHGFYSMKNSEEYISMKWLEASNLMNLHFVLVLWDKLGKSFSIPRIMKEGESQETITTVIPGLLYGEISCSSQWEVDHNLP